MRKWSPYCDEPMSAVQSLSWLRTGFIFMGAYGTPHYPQLDVDLRAEFEDLLAHGKWRNVPRLADEAALEGVHLPAEFLTDEPMRLAHSIASGKPLPPADRRVCVRLASAIGPILRTVEHRCWIENPTPPPGWKPEDSQQPGSREKAEQVLAALLNELRPQHAPDFAWVHCHLGEFSFSSNQRPAIRALWEDWEIGGLGLGSSYLLGLAGSSNAAARVRDLFKGSKAWETLIVGAERKDTYRLALDAPS